MKQWLRRRTEMKELSIFQRMTSSTAELINVVNREVSTKCCQPFAVRAFEALNSLGLKNEDEARRASNIFLDNLQALIQGGITTEDYDKLDLVKRGNAITISARVQALIRSARRKGFTIVETVIAVPKDDDIYFEEDYKDGIGIVYLLRDKRINPDRDITAERLVKGYFKRYLCRLEVKEVKTNRTIMTVTEMTNDEIMYAQSSSDNGIYQSEWVEYQDKSGKTKKKKVIYDGTNGTEVKLNPSAIWYKWTAEMVKKTIVRRALKNIREALPELSQTIMAFDSAEDVYVKNTPNNTGDDVKIIEVDGINNTDVDLLHLTDEQQKDVDEVFEIYKQNPANAKMDAEAIKEKYENGVAVNELVNEYYAELVNLSKSKKLYPLVENVINGVPHEKN